MIGRQFLFLGLFMLLIGGLLAMMVRWELAWPETVVPGFSWIPEPYMYNGVIPPQTYNALFTMHATIMIFFVVMPIMVDCYHRAYEYSSPEVEEDYLPQDRNFGIKAAADRVH